MEPIQRLMWEAQHAPVYHQGVSEAAFRRMRDVVGALEQAPAKVFRLPPAGDSGVHRHVRFLAALVPDNVPDECIAVVIHDIINNAHVTPAIIQEILNGREMIGTGTSGNPGAPGRGLPIAPGDIRRAGRMLRQGLPQRQVAENTGIHRATINKLSVFLGTVDAREEYLRDVAADQIEAGEADPAVFAAEYGIKPGRAKRLLKEVGEGLAA